MYLEALNIGKDVVMEGLASLEEAYGWMEPLSFLTEDILTGTKATPHSALVYHGDNMPPEMFCKATKTYKNRSRRYDTGLYCVRNPERVLQNFYGANGFAYELYCRGMDNFFCTKMEDYRLLHPETKCQPNGHDFIREQLLNTGDFDHDPDAAEILAKNIYIATKNTVASSKLGAIAMRIISLYSRITTLFNGIFYYGSSDGDCCLVWNFNCLTPVRYVSRRQLAEGTWGQGDQSDPKSLFKPIFVNGRISDELRQWRKNNPKTTFTNYGFSKDSKNFFEFVFTPESIHKFSLYADSIERELMAGKPVDPEEASAKIAKAIYGRFEKAVASLDRSDSLQFAKMVSGLVSRNVSVSGTNSNGYLNNQWLDLTKLQKSTIGSVALARFYRMAASMFGEVEGRMRNLTDYDERRSANPFFQGEYDEYAGSDTTETTSISKARTQLEGKALDEARNAAANCFVRFLCGKTKAERDFWKYQLSNVLPNLSGGTTDLRSLLRDKTFLSSRLLGYNKQANYEDRGAAARSEIMPSYAYERLFAQLSKFQQNEESGDEFVMSPAFAGCYVFAAYKEGRQPDAKMLQTLHMATDLFDRIDSEAKGLANVSDKDMKNGLFASSVLGTVLKLITYGKSKYYLLQAADDECHRSGVIYRPDPSFEKYVLSVANALVSQL